MFSIGHSHCRNLALSVKFVKPFIICNVWRLANRLWYMNFRDIVFLIMCSYPLFSFSACHSHSVKTTKKEKSKHTDQVYSVYYDFLCKNLNLFYVSVNTTLIQQWCFIQHRVKEMVKDLDFGTSYSALSTNKNIVVCFTVVFFVKVVLQSVNLFILNLSID